MSDLTLKEILEEIRKDLDKRTRFSQIDNFVNPPTIKEVDAAIFDAVQDINALEPMTSYTIEGIHGEDDGRWYRCLMLGASKNVINMLILDWTAHGLSVDLGDGVALEDRLSNYNTLHDKLKTEFDELLQKLKASVHKHTNVKTFTTRPAERAGRANDNSFGRRARSRIISTRRS